MNEEFKKNQRLLNHLFLDILGTDEVREISYEIFQENCEQLFETNGGKFLLKRKYIARLLEFYDIIKRA